MDEFELELKKGFLEEASQMITDAEQCFLALESSPNDKSILEKIFRLAHNIKGSAKAVGFNQVGEFAHELESYLLKMKDGAIPVHGAATSLLLRCSDYLTKNIDALKEDFNASLDSSELLSQIHAAMHGGIVEVVKAPELEGKAGHFEGDDEAPQTPEVMNPVEADTHLSQIDTQEQLIEALAEETDQHLAPPPEAREPEIVESPTSPVEASPTPAPSQTHAGTPSQGGATSKSDESIRVSLNRLEKLINFVGELVILETVLKEQTQGSESTVVRKTAHQLGKVTKEIQDLSMGLRMVPLKQTFQKMQRIVRDTSSSLSKKVHLNLVGEDTEVDKTVLENLGDPLVHLIRNAVDHGIESEEQRIASGKNPMGTITLGASHQGGALVIEIVDDGGGINAQKLRAKAIEKGMIKNDAQLSDKDAYNLIFHSGFSTKAQVTDISGRGVGMDVVKTNIEALQGEIQLDTELGKGTTFRVRLPLTLAIIDGMIVKSEEHRFVIPLSHVHESTRPTAEDVFSTTDLGEVFSLRGEKLPLYRLDRLFGVRRAQNVSIQDAIAVVIRSHGNGFAILVDEILGLHQVVIKQLGLEHRHLKGFSGSAILGDGKPALILELTDLVSRQKKPEAPQARRLAS